MTPKLLLNSTKPITKQERLRGVVCVFHSLPPPLYFYNYSSKNRRLEAMRSCHVEGVRRWGPWAGRPTRVVGRLPRGANRPQTSSGGLVWASACPNTGAWLVLTGFDLVLGLLLVQLSLNLCSEFICDFILAKSVLVTCILARKHILQFSKGKV